MAVIIVDFDGTLYRDNSVLVTLKGAQKIITIGQWACIAGNIIKGFTDKLKGRKVDFRFLFLKSFFKQMEGRSREELHIFFKSLIETGHQGINYELVMRLEKHLNNGDRIVISSGSLQPFLEIFIDYLGIQADSIGTLLYYDEKGKCTGEISKINHGAEKVRRIKHWINENGIDGDEIWAYADSESDIPILEFADKAVIVEPSDSLKRIAELRGWEVFH